MTNHIYIDCKDLQAVDAERKVTGVSALDTVEVRKINAEDIKKIYVTIRNISAKLLEHLASTLPTMNIGELRQGNIERMIAEFEPSITDSIEQTFAKTRGRILEKTVPKEENTTSKRYRINEDNPNAIQILLDISASHEAKIRNALNLKLDDTWPEAKEIAARLQSTNHEHLLPGLLEYEVLKVLILKYASVREKIEILAPFLGGEEEAKKIMRIFRDLLLIKNAITE
jgi:hypothetical protein